MKILITTVLFLLLSILSFSQEFKTLKDLNPLYINFEKLKSTNPDSAKQILMNIENSKLYQFNDSVKIMNLLTWGNFFIAQNDLPNAKKTFDKCIKLGEQKKIYFKTCVCAHNKAVVYQIENKIDSGFVAGDKAIELSKLAGDSIQLYKAFVANARRMAYKGNFNESNDQCFKYLEEVKDLETKGVILSLIATNYDELNISDKAKIYMRQSIEVLKKLKKNELLYKSYANLANSYNADKNYKMALITADSILMYSQSLDAYSFYNLHKSIAYKGLNDWKNALIYINRTLEIDKKSGNEHYEALDYKERASVYLQMKSYDNALADLETAMQKMKNKTDRVQEKQLFRDYVDAYLSKTNPKVALVFNRFVLLNDSLNKETVDKNFAELDTKYQATQKETTIKTQQLQIEKEKSKRNFAFSVIGFLLLVSLFLIFWIRNRQKQRELKSANEMLNLKQSLQAMELQNLNQQLNPHEIKNLLAAISPEIQEKAPAAYRNMIKLLNLIKSTLGQQGMTESLQNQMEQAKHFLELEKLVLPVKLDYQIIDESVNKQVHIPRLLLKNMVENAVKHGIRNKPEGGEVILTVREENHFIEIVVDDNGTGRNLSISKDSGIGISTYTNLFEMLNTKNQQKAALIITDKKVGTRIDIKIPTDYNYMN